MIAVLAICRIGFAQAAPLSGSVVTSTEKGIRDVRVVLRASSDDEAVTEVVTDENGAFSIPIESLRPGYELHLSKDGYDDVVQPITPQLLVMAHVRVVMEGNKFEPPPEPAGASATPTPRPQIGISSERKRAIELYNKGVEAWEEAKSASDAMERQEQQEALQMIRQAASLDPTFAEPLVMLSRLAVKNQNWAEASRYSEDLLRIDPNDIDAVRTLYMCMVIMRHHLRIGDAIQRLVAVDPDTLPTIEEHASTFSDNQISLMAKAMYEALTEVSPDPATAYLNLGVACAQFGDVECVRDAFTTFLEVAPEDDPQRQAVEDDLAALDQPEVPEALRREESPGPIG
jgi:Flp pilus assembly protein TadD